MSPEHMTLQQTIAEEHARLWMLVRHDIAALRQLGAESQQIVAGAHAEKAATRRSRVVGAPDAPPSSTEQDDST